MTRKISEEIEKKLIGLNNELKNIEEKISWKSKKLNESNKPKKKIQNSIYKLQETSKELKYMIHVCWEVEELLDKKETVKEEIDKFPKGSRSKKIKQAKLKQIQKEFDAFHNSADLRVKKRKPEFLLGEFLKNVVPMAKLVDALTKQEILTDYRDRNATREYNNFTFKRRKIANGAVGNVVHVSTEDENGKEREFAVKMPLTKEEVVKTLEENSLNAFDHPKLFENANVERTINEKEYNLMIIVHQILPLNTPKVHGYDKKTQKLVMEYIRGNRLIDISKTDLQKNPELIEELGKVIATMHNHNFIHGDLYEKNIILCDRTWKLIDFEKSSYGGKEWNKAISIESLKSEKIDLDELYLSPDTKAILNKSYLINRNFKEIAPYLIQKKDRRMMNMFFDFIVHIIKHINETSPEVNEYIFELIEIIENSIYRHRKVADRKDFETLKKEIKLDKEDFEKFKEKIKKNSNIRSSLLEKSKEKEFKKTLKEAGLLRDFWGKKFQRMSAFVESFKDKFFDYGKYKKDYTIETNELGEGGVAKVFDFSARHNEGDEYSFAIKTPKKEMEIEEREYDLMLIAHQILPNNTPKVHGYDKKTQRIIMEKIKGTRIHLVPVKKLQKNTKLIAELGKIIAVLHNNMFIHYNLDFNHGNIILNDNDVWKLIDFGFSEYYGNRKENVESEALIAEKNEFTVNTDFFHESLSAYGIKTNFCKNYLIHRNFKELAPPILQKDDIKTAECLFELIFFVVEQITEPSEEVDKYLSQLIGQMSDIIYNQHKEAYVKSFEKFKKDIKHNKNVHLPNVLPEGIKKMEGEIIDLLKKYRDMNN